MAVAPPFANLLGGITKLPIRKPKSLPVHRGQVDFENSGTTIIKTMRLPLRSRLAPPGVGAPLKVLPPIVPERSMLPEICVGGKQRNTSPSHNMHVTPAPDDLKFP
jgi:hypothetical protein